MTFGEFIHPSLLRMRPDVRREALRQARRTPLDVPELLGMAAALVAALLAAELHSMPGVVAGAAAILLLLLRRTRRGLRQAIHEQRMRGSACPSATP